MFLILSRHVQLPYLEGMVYWLIYHDVRVALSSDSVFNNLFLIFLDVRPVESTYTKARNSMLGRWVVTVGCIIIIIIIIIVFRLSLRNAVDTTQFCHRVLVPVALSSFSPWSQYFMRLCWDSLGVYKCSSVYYFGPAKYPPEEYPKGINIYGLISAQSYMVHVDWKGLLSGWRDSFLAQGFALATPSGPWCLTFALVWLIQFLSQR